MLPARLRGTAEPPIVSKLELLYVIEPYEVDAPARVLQQLVARAIAAVPARPRREAVASAPVDSDSTALLIMPFNGPGETVDEYPSEQIAPSAVASTAGPDRLPFGHLPGDGPANAAPDETDAPAQVLQHTHRPCRRRTSRPARGSVTPQQVEDDSTTLLIVPFEGSDDALDEYPPEQNARRGVDSVSRA